MLIGISMFDCGWGGIQIQTYNHIKYSKHEFIIFADSKGQMEDEFKNLSNVKELVYCEDKEIGKLCNEKKIDFFFHHTINHISRPSINDIECPIVVFHHCAWKPIYNPDRIKFMITSSICNVEIIKQNKNFDKTKIFIIPLSIDISRYENLNPDKIREKFNIPEDKLIIGRFGRLEPGKKPSDFLQICSELNKKYNNLFFILGGAKSIFVDDKYIRDLKIEAQQLGLGNNILFTGEMEEIDKMSLISLFDVYLYPTSGEGFCMAYLEAMYLKKPIVTYDNEIAKEVVHKAGLFGKDNKELEEKVIELISNDSLRNQLGEFGKNRVISQSNAKWFSKQIDNIFDTYLEV